MINTHSPHSFSYPYLFSLFFPPLSLLAPGKEEKNCTDAWSTPCPNKKIMKEEEPHALGDRAWHERKGIEARDADQHPLVHRMTTTTESSGPQR